MDKKWHSVQDKYLDEYVEHLINNNSQVNTKYTLHAKTVKNQYDKRKIKRVDLFEKLGTNTIDYMLFRNHYEKLIK